MNLLLANEPDKLENDVDMEIDLEEPHTIFDVRQWHTYHFFFFFFWFSILTSV